MASKFNDLTNFLFWLDDSVNDFKNVLPLLRMIFAEIFMFTDPEAFLEQLKLIDPNRVRVSVLISGKYGQLIVREDLEPMVQVKNIYVFCVDTEKHSQWAQTCDKVRSVSSQFESLVQRMQYDNQNETEKPDDDVPSENEENSEQSFDFDENSSILISDDNFLDQLAFELILQSSDVNFDEFKQFSREKSTEKNRDKEKKFVKESSTLLESTESIGRWFDDSFSFLQIFSHEIENLWSSRWFFQKFFRQISTVEQLSIEENSSFSLFSTAKFEKEIFDSIRMKINENFILNKFLVGFSNRNETMKILEENRNDEREKNFVSILLEIKIRGAVKKLKKFVKIDENRWLILFAARFRFVKIEFVESSQPFWILGLIFDSTNENENSNRQIFEFYLNELKFLKNFHRAIGKIFILKGQYERAENWLKNSANPEDLAEIYFRRGEFEKTLKIFDSAPEKNSRLKMFRAFSLISSSENIPDEGRSILIELNIKIDEKLIRSEIYFGLAFFNLNFRKDFREAENYFQFALENLQSFLPENHPLIGKGFLGLGFSFYAQNQFEKAKKNFLRAFQIQKISLPDNHPDFGSTFSALARCLIIEKDFQQAEEKLDASLKIFRRNFTQQINFHPQIIATHRDLKKLKKNQPLKTRTVLLDYV